MPELETDVVQGVGQVLDLRSVDRLSRADAWQSAVRTRFPGVSVKIASYDLPVGVINHISLGGGELFAVQSLPADVSFHPSRAAGREPMISLTVQAKGRTMASQGGRSNWLEPGDICVIDEADPFRLANDDCSTLLFLRVPRRAVISRYPQTEQLFALPLRGHEPGSGLLADMLLRLFSDAPKLGEGQRSALLGAVVQMLGATEPFSRYPGPTGWRVQRALQYIEDHLATAGLTADDVARDQQISRRRLDEILCDALGRSIAAQIWARRLDQASADLRDPRLTGSSVAQIAFANGFEDPAHFTRAFKKRFEVTPGQWRLQ